MQQIIFEFNTKHGVFRDALYLEDDHTFTPEEVDAMKLERLNNWWAMIDQPDQLEILPMPDNG
jgi:hypothetical protein